MKKLLTMFGIYTESDILKAIIRVQDNHASYQKELSDRLMKNYFNPDDNKKYIETNSIATQILSYNPYIDIILELRYPNSTLDKFKHDNEKS